nr:zinc finger, CCHC-type, retrotransposon Gag domain protein [Tanacetum cinerariifolium]
MPPHRNNRRNETPKVDPAFATAVQQAVRALLPELTAKITTGMNNANNTNNGNNANKRNDRCDAPTPVEAENWIAHIEKIFEAGTPKEQAKNFKLALNDIAHDKLVNMEFFDVAEAANAARNIEILQKEMLASTPNENKKRTQ